MCSERAQLDRVNDILGAIQSIEERLGGLDEAAFLADGTVRKATQFDLFVIGEAAKQLDAAAEARHPEIPWRRVRGLRDIIAHAYFRIDEPGIWITATESLPPLKSAMLAEKAFLEGLTRSP